MSTRNKINVAYNIKKQVVCNWKKRGENYVCNK